jgi:hypothetical protein
VSSGPLVSEQHTVLLLHRHISATLLTLASLLICSSHPILVEAITSKSSENKRASISIHRHGLLGLRSIQEEHLAEWHQVSLCTIYTISPSTHPLSSYPHPSITLPPFKPRPRPTGKQAVSRTSEQGAVKSHLKLNQAASTVQDQYLRIFKLLQNTLGISIHLSSQDFHDSSPYRNPQSLHALKLSHAAQQRQASKHYTRKERAMQSAQCEETIAPAHDSHEDLASPLLPNPVAASKVVPSSLHARVRWSAGLVLNYTSPVQMPGRTVSK